MYSDSSKKNNLKRFAFPVLIAFWVVIGVAGFSNSVSDVILEAVTAVGVYG